MREGDSRARGWSDTQCTALDYVSVVTASMKRQKVAPDLAIDQKNGDWPLHLCKIVTR